MGGAGLRLTSTTRRPRLAAVTVVALLLATPAAAACGPGLAPGSGGPPSGPIATSAAASASRSAPATPTPVEGWVRHTSVSFTYSMAHPPNVEVVSTNELDEYRLADGAVVSVAAQDLPPGTSVDALEEQLLATYEADLGSPSSVAPATIGGRPARRLEYHLPRGDGGLVFLDYATVERSQAWEVFLVVDGARDPEGHVAVFEEMVETFRFE